MRIDELEIGFRSAFPSLLFFFPIQLLLSPFAVTYFIRPTSYILPGLCLSGYLLPPRARIAPAVKESTPEERKKKRKKEKTNR